jgi:hypothetical protein
MGPAECGIRRSQAVTAAHLGRLPFLHACDSENLDRGGAQSPRLLSFPQSRLSSSLQSPLLLFVRRCCGEREQVLEDDISEEGGGEPADRRG